MKKVWIFIFSIVFVIFRSACPVVVVLHGSFAAKGHWWTPQGNFFKELELQAKQMGQQVVPFCWSGYPSQDEIEKSALMLARLVLSYPVEEQIFLVGHSHGGNVICRASQILYDSASQPTFPLNQFLQESFGKETVQQIYPHSFTVWDVMPTVKSLAKRTMGNLKERFKKESVPIKNSTASVTGQDGVLKKEVVQVISGSHSKLDNLWDKERKHVIEKIYLLGIPVNPKTYPPNMDVVGSVINLYSYGDNVQKVLGFYSRRFPLQEDLTNIRVLMKAPKNSKLINPGHSQMHASIVGRWLLLIPEFLSVWDVGNFGQFEYNTNGQIVFDSYGIPEYSIIPDITGTQTLPSS